MAGPLVATAYSPVVLLPRSIIRVTWGARAPNRVAATARGRIKSTHTRYHVEPHHQPNPKSRQLHCAPPAPSLDLHLPDLLMSLPDRSDSALPTPLAAPPAPLALVVARHLPQDHLHQPGGDIAHQIISDARGANAHSATNSAAINGNYGAISAITGAAAVAGGTGANGADLSDGRSVHSSAPLAPLLVRRSLLFSAVHDAHRRELTALDINVVGGFRRDFLVNKYRQHHRRPPTFLAENFLQFLLLYGHFAGETLDDDDDDDDVSEDGHYVSSPPDDLSVFDDTDETLALLTAPPLPPGVPNLTPSHQRIALYSRHSPATGGATMSSGAARAAARALVAKTYFLVFKLLVGLGVLFLPRAFYNGGLGFSIVTLTVFGVITSFCYMVLIGAKRATGLALFGELAYSTYGAPLKWCVTALIVVSQVGFVGTYLLFTSENIGEFLRYHLGERAPGLWAIFVAQFIILVPLVLIRNIAKLSLVLMVLLACIVIGLVIITYFCCAQLVDHGFGPNIRQFNPQSWTMLVGVAVTAFEGIGLILPIELAMSQPERFPEVLAVLMLVITALFVGVGTLGYTAFGDKVALIIILNLPGGSFWVQLIMVLYSVAVVLTAPLQLFPAIRIGELVLFHPRRSTTTGRLYTPLGKRNPQVKWRKNLFRVVVLVAVCAVAYANADNIDKFVSINGCFACIPLVYIYPPLIHIRTINKQRRERTWVYYCDYVVVALGGLVMAYSAYQLFFLN